MYPNNRVSNLEILIAIIILVIFACVAVPRFLSILRKSEEIATKKGLYSLRTAIALYYEDNGGKYPDANIAKELVEKGYIQSIPYVYLPYSKKSNLILIQNIENNIYAGGWLYKIDDTPDSTGRSKGQIWINSSHNGWSNL
jgi:type II secretory pathway pseudopilin PulG